MKNPGTHGETNRDTHNTQNDANFVTHDTQRYHSARAERILTHAIESRHTKRSHTQTSSLVTHKHIDQRAMNESWTSRAQPESTGDPSCLVLFLSCLVLPRTAKEKKFRALSGFETNWKGGTCGNFPESRRVKVGWNLVLSVGVILESLGWNRRGKQATCSKRRDRGTEAFQAS